MSATVSANSNVCRTEALYLLHLLACGLRDVPACAAPQGLDWAAVDRLASFNSVRNLAWFGARALDDMPGDLRSSWELCAKRTLYKHAMFDIEREALLAEVAKRGMAYLPLKGVHIRGYYPRPEMRSFADNDILYGFVEPMPDAQRGYRVCGATPEEREATVRRATDEMVAIGRARGYNVKHAGLSNCEELHKKPFYNFEMHRVLMEVTTPLHAYYENPWQRAVPLTSGGLEFGFSNEDEYLYFVAHIFKHFDKAGCGVRYVADEFAFLQRKESQMDWAYIERELACMCGGIATFERDLRGLARAVFGIAGQDGPGTLGLAGPAYLETLTVEQEALALFMMGAGTYGTVALSIERKLDKLSDGRSDGAPNVRSAKLTYIKERIFLPEDALRDSYPLFYRHKALRPVLPIIRLVKGLFTNLPHLVSEVRGLRGYKR